MRQHDQTHAQHLLLRSASIRKLYWCSQFAALIVFIKRSVFTIRLLYQWFFLSVSYCLPCTTERFRMRRCKNEVMVTSMCKITYNKIYDDICIIIGALNKQVILNVGFDKNNINRYANISRQDIEHSPTTEISCIIGYSGSQVCKLYARIVAKYLFCCQLNHRLSHRIYCSRI